MVRTDTSDHSHSYIFEKSKTLSSFVHPAYSSSNMADIGTTVPVCHKMSSLGKLVQKSCFSRHVSHLVLVITVAMLFGSASSAQILSNDINTAMKTDTNQPIKVQWGISDTSAVIGKVFNFHIPQDAFEGNVHTYKVLESGKDVLPKWIKFDESIQALRGVPSLGDKGLYNLEVIAFGGDKTPQAKDVFTVVVKDDVPHVSSSKPLKSMGKTSAKPVNCLSSEPVTMVTIVVDTDLDQLSPVDKFELASKLTSHLNIASEMLKMAPVGDKAKFDSSALVAGPGDAKTSQFSGAFLSWLVGCGKVEPDHMPILQQVETSSANGDMSNAIGHGVVGWHVTNSRLKPTVKRMRRQVHATKTQGITMPPPTRLPAVTVTSTDGGMPVHPDMTRSVPSMVSPTFSDIRPTPSLPPQVTTSTREMPPKIVPGDDITPTKVTDMEATKLVTEEIDPVFSYTDKPDMSRPHVLEPSMSMSESEMTRKTEELPTSSTEMTKQPTSSTGTRPTDATQVPPIITTTRTPEPPRRTPKPPKVMPKDPYECPQDGIDRHPSVWEKIENMEVGVGELVRFKIPEKAFFDCEDGNTRKLVVDVHHNVNWLTFNAEKQLLVGLPLKEDGERVHELKVIVIDSKGAVAVQKFLVTVKSASQSDDKVNHEFALTIDVDYDEFMSDPKNRIELSNKIARLYGDKNSKKMTITKIERGSVIFAWTNNTVPTGDCPVGDIVELMSKVFTKNMTLKEEAKKSMEPYKINKAAAVPAGSCENVDFEEALKNYDDTAKPKPTPTYDTVTPGSEPEPEDKDDDDDDDGGAESKEKDEDDDDNIWITTVVPAVVIIVILFIALIIACILYRKKRKGKMDMQDHHTFVNKGIPVIFADELEDKPSDSAKPLIMEEEKPPNPPPGYRRTSSESPDSTPPRNHKDIAAANQDEEEMDENDVTSPLYRPPPPVTASSENKQPRPHVQPAYRNPPPYVPP